MGQDSSHGPNETLLRFLKEIGFTGDKELEQTHIRVTKFLQSFAPKSEQPDLSIVPTASSDPVILRGLTYYSLCAHHLLPFFGEATVAILPDGAIAGLGGIPKALSHYAEQPQIQERLSGQVADFLMSKLKAEAVVVTLSATQLCMEMRGAKAKGKIYTVASRGSEKGISRLENLLAQAV